MGFAFALLALLGVVLALVPRPRLLRGAFGTAAAVPLLWSAHHDWECSRAFDAASVGDRRIALVADLGSPTNVTLWSGHPDDSGISPRVGRAECLWYHVFFSVEAYEFCFTADDRLDHKYDWQSW